MAESLRGQYRSSCRIEYNQQGLACPLLRRSTDDGAPVDP